MAYKLVEAFSSLFKEKSSIEEGGFEDDSNTIFVGSTLLRVPVEECDGTVLLPSVQMYFPDCKGLWYIHEDDKITKSLIKMNKSTNKLFPPVNGWGQRTYHALFDSNEICSSFEKDLAVERFQISTKFFHQSAKMLHAILDNNVLFDPSDINNLLFKDCIQFGYYPPEDHQNQICYNEPVQNI